MGYQQGLSGLSGASNALDVIGNNIANANTVGFKSSTAQFADMYANSVATSNGQRTRQCEIASLKILRAGSEQSHGALAAVTTVKK